MSDPRKMKKERKNTQQIFFPFAGIFEEIIAVDCLYHYTKTLPNKRQDNADKIEATDNTFMHPKTNRNIYRHKHRHTHMQTQKYKNIYT